MYTPFQIRINNIAHMSISGTEPSSVIPSQISPQRLG